MIEYFNYFVALTRTENDITIPSIHSYYCGKRSLLDATICHLLAYPIISSTARILACASWSLDFTRGQREEEEQEETEE